MKNSAIVFETILEASKAGTLTKDMILNGMQTPGMTDKQRDCLTRLWLEATTGKKEHESKDFVDFCVQGGGCSGR